MSYRFEFLSYRHRLRSGIRWAGPLWLISNILLLCCHGVEFGCWYEAVLDFGIGWDRQLALRR